MTNPNEITGEQIKEAIRQVGEQKVKRYTPMLTADTLYLGMAEDTSGSWVKADDYAALEARLADLEETCDLAILVATSELQARVDKAEAALAEAREQLKGVACEVCWTTSWCPIERVEDAQGVNTKTDADGALLCRCDYCWHEQAYSLELKEARGLLRECLIEFTDSDERDEVLGFLLNRLHTFLDRTPMPAPPND
jgi:hypothetical protein